MERFMFIPKHLRFLMGLFNHKEYVYIKLQCPHCGKTIKARIDKETLGDKIVHE